MALALFAITLFVSAFILFLVQPIIGKTILPKLGGTPQVWNTCMVFFQSVLLLGYFYTHASSTRLSQRLQLILHCILLFVPFAILLPFGGPFDITNWIPELGANPLISTLVLLFGVVGIPFFVVSTVRSALAKVVRQHRPSRRQGSLFPLRSQQPGQLARAGPVPHFD